MRQWGEGQAGSSSVRGALGEQREHGQSPGDAEPGQGSDQENTQAAGAQSAQESTGAGKGQGFVTTVSLAAFILGVIRSHGRASGRAWYEQACTSLFVTPTHQDEAKQNGVWGPGGHTCSLRPFQEGPLGPSELLLTRWTPVLPEEFQAFCSSCLGLRCIKERLATGLHLSGTQGVGSPSILRAQVNANLPLETLNPSCARWRVSSSRVIQRCRCHEYYPAEGNR